MYVSSECNWQYSEHIQGCIHTLEMAPEHQSIKARLFNRVQNAYLWIVAVVMVMYVQVGKHSLLMCPASWTPYVHLHKTTVCVRSTWYAWTHLSEHTICVCTCLDTCTHRECSTSMQVESCERKLHGCFAVTRSFDTIGAEMCRHIMSASGAGRVTSHCTNAYMCT